MTDLCGHGLEMRPVRHVRPGGHREVSVVREAHHLGGHQVGQVGGDDDCVVLLPCLFGWVFDLSCLGRMWYWNEYYAFAILRSFWHNYATVIFPIVDQHECSCLGKELIHFLGMTSLRLYPAYIIIVIALFRIFISATKTSTFFHFVFVAIFVFVFVFVFV